MADIDTSTNTSALDQLIELYKQIKGAVAEQNIDSELKSNSTNPVQNSTLYTKFSTIDTALTQKIDNTNISNTVNNDNKIPTSSAVQTYVSNQEFLTSQDISNCLTTNNIQIAIQGNEQDDNKIPSVPALIDYVDTHAQPSSQDNAQIINVTLTTGWSNVDPDAIPEGLVSSNVTGAALIAAITEGKTPVFTLFSEFQTVVHVNMTCYPLSVNQKTKTSACILYCNNNNIKIYEISWTNDNTDLNGKKFTITSKLSIADEEAL